MRKGAVLHIGFLILFFLFASYNVNAEVLTLSQGLQLAVQNNRLIRITEQEEAVSEADIALAKSLMLPSINASLSQTFLSYQPAAIFVTQTPSIGFGIPPRTNVQSVLTSEKSFASYSLSIQQLLYDFERNSSLYKESSVVFETKKLDTLRVRNLVALDFSFVYFDLLEAEKMIVVSEREVERLMSHLRDAKSLYDEGVITKNDLLQAEVRLSDARQRLVSIKNIREITASRLNSLLSRPLEADVEVMDISEAPSDGVDLGIGNIWVIAEKQRPEIKIIEANLKALNLEETAKRSEYYPRFFAQGAYDHTDNRFQVHEGNWSLTVGMNLNLFSGGSTKAELLKIDHQKLKILEQKDRIIDEVRLEVERYVLNFKTAGEKVAVTKDAVQQAEENLRINKVRYEEGVGTATEVLDAVTLLTIAETNFYRSLYDFKRAEAGTMYSMGKDLREVYR